MSVMGLKSIPKRSDGKDNSWERTKMKKPRRGEKKLFKEGKL